MAVEGRGLIDFRQRRLNLCLSEHLDLLVDVFPQNGCSGAQSTQSVLFLREVDCLELIVAAHEGRWIEQRLPIRLVLQSLDRLESLNDVVGHRLPWNRLVHWSLQGHHPRPVQVSVLLTKLFIKLLLLILCLRLAGVRFIFLLRPVSHQVLPKVGQLLHRES